MANFFILALLILHSQSVLQCVVDQSMENFLSLVSWTKPNQTEGKIYQLSQNQVIGLTCCLLFPWKPIILWIRMSSSSLN